LGNSYRQNKRKNKGSEKRVRKNSKKLLTVLLTGVKIHKLSQKTRWQKQKELRKIKALAKIHQKLFAKWNLENQRSNNTQTLKFLEKKFF